MWCEFSPPGSTGHGRGQWAQAVEILTQKDVSQARNGFLLITGTLVSFIVSIFAIRLLLGYIRNHDFKVFGVYRIILGIVVIIYLRFLPRACLRLYTPPHADKDKKHIRCDNGSALQGYAFYSFIIVWIEISAFRCLQFLQGTLPQSSVPHRTVHRTAHKMHAPAHKAAYKKLL